MWVHFLSFQFNRSFRSSWSHKLQTYRFRTFLSWQQIFFCSSSLPSTFPFYLPFLEILFLHLLLFHPSVYHFISILAWSHIFLFFLYLNFSLLERVLLNCPVSFFSWDSFLHRLQVFILPNSLQTSSSPNFFLSIPIFFFLTLSPFHYSSCVRSLLPTFFFFHSLLLLPFSSSSSILFFFFHSLQCRLFLWSGKHCESFYFQDLQHGIYP